MKRRGYRTRWAYVAMTVLVLSSLVIGARPSVPAYAAGLRRIDPAQVLPLDQVDPRLRAGVIEVIRENSFHQQGKPDTFPCNPRIYLALLNEPALTLALWNDLSPNPAKLHQVGPGRYQGTDGSGTTATWEFALRSPRLNVLLCDLEYQTPRGNAKLEGRIVLIVRSSFFREPNDETWVKHDVEAYVKVDSRGWRTIAATLRPIIEKVLNEQVEEAGWFVSLMSRLVEMYPDWATSVARNQVHLSPEIRDGFRALVAQTRRPGAFTGRPVLTAETESSTVRR